MKNLRSSTIELINKDYADFVDLSTNLVSLNQSINGVEVPITTIKDEITVMYFPSLFINLLSRYTLKLLTIFTAHENNPG